MLNIRIVIYFYTGGGESYYINLHLTPCIFYTIDIDTTEPVYYLFENFLTQYVKRSMKNNFKRLKQAFVKYNEQLIIINTSNIIPLLATHGFVL